MFLLRFGWGGYIGVGSSRKNLLHFHRAGVLVYDYGYVYGYGYGYSYGYGYGYGYGVDFRKVDRFRRKNTFLKKSQNWLAWWAKRSYTPWESSEPPNSPPSAIWGKNQTNLIIYRFLIYSLYIPLKEGPYWGSAHPDA